MIFRARETLRVRCAYKNSIEPYILSHDSDIQINIFKPVFLNSGRRIYVFDEKNHKTDIGAINIPAGLLDVYQAETLEESKELIRFSDETMKKPLLFVSPNLGNSTREWLEQEAFFFMAGETLEKYQNARNKKQEEIIGKRNILSTFVEAQCKENGITYYRLACNSGLFQIEEVSASGVSVFLKAKSLENAVWMFSSCFSR